MSLKTLKLVGLSLLLLGTFNSALADKFWRAGKVDRVLVDSERYGGCMVRITTNIANGCPDNGWVSLDCTNTYFSDGKNKYAMALTALSLDKNVSIYVDNAKKTTEGNCVAQRVDIVK